MTHEQLTYDDLLRIVELIKSSEQFSEFRLKVGEIEVELRRRNAGGTRVAPVAGVTASADETKPAAEPRRADATTEPLWPDDAHVIRSPMVGTFYRAPEPGAAAFVDVGQAVEPASIVCIIEVMKLMNSIPAGVRGKVLQVLVEDAAAVQAGQPLIIVQPDSR